jgi:NAD(P) transhydrogenase subunit beta
MTSTLLIAPLAGSLVNFVNASFIVAGLLFIFALAGLSKFETSKKGNAYGILGMVIAIVATIVALVKLPGYSPVSIVLLFIPMLIGGAFGVWKAVKVEMTGMPELIAQLHSFVGLAAVLIGFNAFAEEGTGASTFQLSEIWIGIFIGALTFTGSLVAWGKLSGKVASKPLTLPGRNLINLGLLVVIIACGIWFSNVSGGIAWLPLALLTLASLFLGFHLVAAIGGADMPVVISMLNSYSGWAAAFSGFSLHIPVLIVTGALVGFSGAILSYIMCKGMNRSFVSVILGGWGGETTSAEAVDGEMIEAHADDVASAIQDADSVIIVPGYGMAVAQAQASVSALMKKLRDQGKTVRFAIQRTERQGDFEETTARRLSSLLPHIGQALRLSFSTESPLHSRLQSLDASGTPAVIVDRTLNLRHRNPAADVLLRGAGFPRDSGGRLQLASPDLQKCLREAVREVLGGCGRAAVGLTLTQPQDLTRSTALVTEAPPASRLYPNARHGGALVTIAREDRPLDLDADDLAVLFDLTPTETRIAGLIGSGVSSERCAAWMDVNRATLRWHLKHVFQKTGTDGQIDLAVLMQSLGAART